MTRKRTFTLILIIFLIICCIFCGLYLIIDPRPARYCGIDDILFSENDLPEGTIIDYRNLPALDEPNESGEIYALFNNTVVYQIVSRYERGRLARNRYERWESALSDLSIVPNQTSDMSTQLDFVSAHASQYDFACGTDLGRYQCRFIATYDEYFIYLRSDISEEGVTHDMFYDFLVEIDHKMSGCFEP
ncbi:MAG: hypothetical protein K8R77_08925 [Anaerolineaceae bacterium]|nr:hypothetical protein [Anaerolineaceae bacterium]